MGVDAHFSAEGPRELAEGYLLTGAEPFGVNVKILPSALSQDGLFPKRGIVASLRSLYMRE